MAEIVALMTELVVECPECGLQAKVLLRDDQVIGNSRGKCRHRTNPLNCPSLRPILSIGRQELNERRVRVLSPRT
jgi:hypothetical protein